MQEARTLVEKVILPWLAKHHPEADMVFMAGSYGRAMKEGGYSPLTSSDVDLVIVYSDLKKGGFTCAVQSFTQEEVGTALGEDKPRMMMIDTNVHDLASLHYHDKTVRENAPFAFINVMFDEGYVLIDKLGIGKTIQEKAKKFLAEGPLPTPAPMFAQETATMKTLMDAIRTADTASDRQMMGILALTPLCEYVLGIKQYWRSGSNQAYRSLRAHFPNEAEDLVNAFSPLLRNGDATAALALMQQYITQGEATMHQRAETVPQPEYPIEQYVPQDVRTESANMFHKFMTEHLCEALETSKRRGELAHLENISASVNFIVRNLMARDGDAAPAAGVDTLRYLNTKLPELMPAALALLAGEDAAPVILAAAEKSLSHTGGLHYQHLRNVYLADMARVNATQPNAKAPRAFKPGFTPKH